jgi:PKD repeat protein
MAGNGKSNPNLMKFKFYLLSILILSISACKKNKQTVDLVPTADFSVVNANKGSDGSYTAPTFVTLNTANSSANASSYAWDVSGGITSSLKQPDFRFTQAGNYTINLKVKSATGNSTSVSKTVKIVDRLLYAVQVTNPNWQNGKIVNLFVRIYTPQPDNTAPALSGDAYPTTVFYQSAVTTATYTQLAPIAIALPTNLVLSPGSKLPGNPTTGFINFGYCLYAQENGSEKLLASSWDTNTLSSIIFNDVISAGISSLELSSQGVTASFLATNNR